ncbi:amino acid adenylation domain-containing protein (plasmid) [Photobacterium damselae]|uniref:non-ribosomal peptide synthetase/type I polyketide synthase n=1 Tax=Photobacterium damselae TaxID=38293 RepID=UPI00254391C2
MSGGFFTHKGIILKEGKSMKRKCEESIIPLALIDHVSVFNEGNELDLDSRVISLGINSIDMGKLRSLMKTKPSFQKLYGMKLSEVLEDLNLEALRDLKAESSVGTADIDSASLTPMQESYLFGAQQGVPCIVYSEFELENVNLSNLFDAIDTVIAQEPMLHAYIHDETRQSILTREHWRAINRSVEKVDDYQEYRENLLDELKRAENRYWELCITNNGSANVLHVAIDMLFMDAASVMLLAGAISDNYNSLLAGETLPASTPLSPSFFDYADNFSAKNAANRAENLGKEALPVYPGPPQLPRRKHESGDSPSFSRVHGVVAEEVWRKLKEKARSIGVTNNALLLSAFSDVVSLYCENQDFTITVTSSDRTLSENIKYQHAVGDFTNVILCPIRESQAASIEEKAKAIHNELSHGIEQSNVNGLDLVRLLRQIHNDPHLNFPIVFTSFLGIFNKDIQFENSGFKLVHQQSQTPQLTLDHQVYEVSGRLVINWDFDENVYSKPQMQGMLNSFLGVLNELAAKNGVSARLSDEEHLLREDTNNTFKEFEGEANKLLHEIVLRQAEKSPEAVAVVDQDKQFTYFEISEMAKTIASRLQAMSVEPGDVVAIVLEKGWEQVVAAIGILMTGASYLPLNPSHPDDRLKNILSIAGCRTALTHGATETGRKWFESDCGDNIACLKIDVEMDRSEGEREYVCPIISPEDSAYIIYTSGSTGAPKGVEIAHEGAVNTCLDINQRFALGDKTVTFGISSLGFDLSVWDIFGTLSTGGTLVMCKPNGTIDPDYWWEQVQSHGVTMWNTVPTSFEMLVQSRPESVEMPIRSVLLSGDAISTNMVREVISYFPAISVHALGGATEASIWSNYHTVDSSTFAMGTELVPYGRPLSNQTMLVLDDRLRYRPEGAVGEIHIGGIGLAKSYFKAPELTAERFIETKDYGRLYKTGDLGRYLPNGEIEIIGRKDSQVKVGGHRVELAEIENCAEELSFVSKASVIHISGAGARLIGFATFSETDRLDDVRKHVGNKLPDYMAPQTWIQLDSIPLTANNKVDKKALRLIAINQTRAEEPDGSVSDSETVQKILELASEVLRVPTNTLSASSNLAEQGLTSLYAVRLVNTLSKEFGKKLPYTLIFNYPNALKLAAYLEGGQEEQVIPSGRRTCSEGPIAIIAASCRLPGGVTSTSEFYQELIKGFHPVSVVPKNRFDIDEIYDENPDTQGASYTKSGSFIESIEKFDNSLFQIPFAEAKAMDPQQRHLLELTYEAFINGGYDYQSLKGSNTGVFIGQMNYDWMMDFDYSREYASTGSAPSISSNRVSYAFDLVGPSMTVDTACSSSLVAVDLAVSKLNSGECELAVAGGVNLILSPEPYIFTCQAQMLSPDGRCATFDEGANGIARGEGAGIVLLKRLADAERDGDPILAVINSTAVNQDGHSASLTAPNGISQRRLLRTALGKAALKSHDIDYIECHGTGTLLGDPIEVEAITDELLQGRTEPLVLGAVKTNLGHLEGAAGIIGLIKAIEVVQNQIVPANLHLKKRNPKLGAHDLPVTFPTQQVSLQEGSKGHITAGVSSFGYGGTNAHVVLSSYKSRSKLKTKQKSTWLFSGQGTVSPGKIAKLNAANSVFNKALERNLAYVATLIEGKVLNGKQLLQVVLEDNQENAKLLRNTQLEQPVIVAIQLAEIDMWHERGVYPSAVVGHSVGELSAATAAGVMTKEQALQLSVVRGKLIGDCPKGVMAAVSVSIDELPKSLPGKIELAAINSTNQVVLVAPEADDFSALEKHGLSYHLLDVSHGFHSSMLEQAAFEFGEAIKSFSLKVPDNSVTFISTKTAVSEYESWMDSQYWSEQITKPVNFKGAMETLVEIIDESQAIIEIGVNPILLKLAAPVLKTLPRIKLITTVDTANGTPSLVGFSHKVFDWEPPRGKGYKKGKDVTPAPVVPEWLSRKILARSQEVNVGSLENVFVTAAENPWVNPSLKSSYKSTDRLLDELSKGTLPSCSGIVFIARNHERDLLNLVQLFKVITSVQNPPKIGVVIDGSKSEQGGAVGICRASRLEISNAVISILISSNDSIELAIQTVQALRGDERYLDNDGVLWESKRESLVVSAEGKETTCDESKLYVISGATGGLGQVATRVLAKNGARNMLLLGSRSVERAAESVKALQKELLGVEIRYECCDVRSKLDVKRIAEKYTNKLDIGGVIHAAGIVEDTLIGNINQEQFNRVYATKFLGAKALFEYFKPEDWFVGYSTVAAEVGSTGQTNYVAANAAMDFWADELSLKGFPITSIQWGVWSDTGIAFDNGLLEKLNSQGYGTLTSEEGASVLTHIINHRVRGVVTASPVSWESFAQPRKERPIPYISSVDTSFTTSMEIKKSLWDSEQVFQIVTYCLGQFIEIEELDTELPFMEAGLSSLDLVQFRQKLLNNLPESVEIPSQFVFNFPTVADVVENLTEQLSACSFSTTETIEPEVDSAYPDIQWTKLNSAMEGRPLFLIGGVMGNVEKTFGPLASELTVPVYGVMPEVPWDLNGGTLTLEQLASGLVESLKEEFPSDEYVIGGLSFGATVSLEMACQLENSGALAGVLLLDPRHLAPFIAPEEPAAFETLLESYSSDKVITSPVWLLQCEVPAWESQSDMMREASRSFMTDDEIAERCQRRCSILTKRTVEGHHFNFLYRFKESTGSSIMDLLENRHERVSPEPIAVIASACRLPGGADTKENLWGMLSEKEDCISDIPASRFDIDAIYHPDLNNIGSSYTRRGGFISSAEYFDYEWFGLTEPEALVMDPQQRTLLEVAYQAFSNAGYEKKELKGSETAVIVGMANDDWSAMGRESEAHNPHFGAGVSSSIAANRISYLLGLTGPSMAIDTACSSSLVSIKVAIDTLRQGSAKSALVAGVNIIAHDRMYVSACATNALSANGRCASFDKDADGYCRGEGVGAVVLKRLSDAQADGDDILAVIHGAAVNQDGKSVSLTAPNGRAQEAVINDALEEAGIAGHEIDYVECHGTGTPLGDPIEIGALKAALGPNRRHPLVLGSIKSNIGHLEGAAGIAGLIKAIEVVRRREAPGIVHFNSLNPNIDVQNFDVVISAQATRLKAEGTVYAGVSSFGFGGTNAHVILSSYGSSRTREERLVPYQRRFLPWRRLANPLLSRRVGAGYGATLRGELAHLWQDHRIQDTTLVPAASHLTMLAGMVSQSREQPASAYSIQNVLMQQPIEVLDSEEQQIRCIQGDNGWSIESGVSEQWQTAVTASSVRALAAGELRASVPAVDAVRKRCRLESYDALYGRLADRGVQFGKGYKNIEQLFLSETEGLAQISVSLDSSIEKSMTLLSTPALDAGIQLLGLCGMANTGVCVPYSLKRATLYTVEEQPSELWAHARLIHSDQSRIEGDVVLFTEDGTCFAELKGLTCRPWRAKDPVGDSLYQIGWRNLAPAIPVVSPEQGGVVIGHSQPCTLPLGWHYAQVSTEDELQMLAEEYVQPGHQGTLVFWSNGEDRDTALGLTFLQQLSARAYSGRAVFVLAPGSKVSAGLSGLVKTSQQENPGMVLQCVYAENRDLGRVLTEGLSYREEETVALTGGKWQAARLERYIGKADQPLTVKTDKTYVISGGLGSLGQVVARYLVDSGATHIVLLSRQERDASSWPESIQSLQSVAEVMSFRCDVANEGDVIALQQHLKKQRWPSVAGLVHTAGVLTDGTLANQSPLKMEEACDAKVRGAEHLRRWLAPQDFIWLYSSAAAVFGSMGQGSYALANSQLDQLAREWQEDGSETAVLSIQWGAWSESGMAVRHGAVARAHDAGYGSISDALGRKVMNRFLEEGTRGVVCVCPLDWSRVQLGSSLVSEWRYEAVLQGSVAPVEMKVEREGGPLQATSPSWELEEIKVVVRQAARKAMGRDVDDTASLMANGLDSLNAVVLSQSLSQELGLSLGAVFALNHPTIDDMSEELHLELDKKRVEMLKSGNTGEIRSNMMDEDLVVSVIPGKLEPIAVVGTACRLPGSINSSNVLWDELSAGLNAVSEIPKTRFDIDEVYSEDKNSIGKSYTRHGAFLKDVEYFDHEAFDIQEAEAQVMDPHQRALLEVGYQALYAAGYERSSLKGKKVGVFVGIANQDWMVSQGQKNAHNPYFGAGVSLSIVSNRISHILGLNGPSMTLDTACSSSLVALDLAVSKLRDRDCNAALVGGVNIMMHHRTFVGSCAANMLSKKGSCSSFDSKADGYCRGEGVGAVVLKRLSDAQADGDDILAVINATAVNQDGASATMTAPNGRAQEAVINDALEEAGIAGHEIDYVECHGTGTQLGDPIEIGALKAALGPNRRHPLVLGSIKSNIGHLEGAAGIAGLIKAIEVVRRREAPGIVHFNSLNPNIDVQNFDVVISAQATRLKAEGTVYAGVSSFGFGGTNAHVILSSYGSNRTREERLVPYQRRFLPWRRLANPLLSRRVGAGYGATLRGELAHLWQDHRIQDTTLVPAASHLTMLAGMVSQSREQPASAYSIQNVLMQQPIEVLDSEEQQIRCIQGDNGWSIESGVSEQWQTAVTASSVRALAAGELRASVPAVDAVRKRCRLESYDALYGRLADRGVQFGKGYKNIEQLFLSETEGLAQISVSLDSSIEKSMTLLSTPALDAGIQLLGLCGMANTGVCVPYSLKRATLYTVEEQPSELWAHARLIHSDQSRIEGDVVLFTEDGTCFAELKGLTCRPWRAKDPVGDSLYQIGWRNLAPAIPVVSPEQGGVVIGHSQPCTLPLGWHYAQVSTEDELQMLAEEYVQPGHQSTLVFWSNGEDRDTALGLTFLQQLSARAYSGRAVFVLAPGSKVSAGLSGLVKTSQQENPGMVLQCVYAENRDLGRVLTEGLSYREEETVALTGGKWQAARLERYIGKADQPLTVKTDKTYVISGGLGSLGQVVARYLVDSGATHIVLLSRQERDASSWPESIQSLQSVAEVMSFRCDVANEGDVIALQQHLKKQRWPSVAGLVHTAGVLTDGTLANQSPLKMEEACDAKVRGAEHLRRWLAPQDFIWLYSSAAAVFGSMGQGSYALANSQLDQLAREWQEDGSETAVLSIQWGAWSESGMAVRHGAVARAHDAGYGSISDALGRKVMNRFLEEGTRGVVCVCPLDWSRVQLGSSLVSEWRYEAVLQGSVAPVEVKVDREGGPLQATSPSWELEKIKVVVRQAARKAMGRDVDDTASLMANGLDSLNAVVLSQSLSQELGLSLGAVFALNHPTIDDMSEELQLELEEKGIKPNPSVDIAEVGISEQAVIETPPSVEQIKEREETKEDMEMSMDIQVDSNGDIAVVSTACRLPGGIDSPEALWDAVYSKRDCVTVVPRDRMAIEQYYDPNPDTIGKSYTNRGAFVEDAEFFDHEFFRIPIAEARAMDPQQRKMLEVSCEAFYKAGYDMASLKGAHVGVFVGQMSHDWAHMHKDDQLVNPYFGAGTSAAITSNRLSYVYGLTGPSITIDTACSSSLVAIDLAIEKLNNGSCEAALVGGVNLMLSHRSFVGCCSAKMLSYAGRCASFDDSADGYCRGEGIGAVVLKRKVDALRDEDEILAVIKGSAVNQDGHSATLTAPNGQAQQKVIANALSRAGIAGKELDYVECHGTGTPLGDPIEIGALKAVTEQGRSKPLVVGTIKSNMGHLEGAAGIAGFIKAVEVVRRRYSPGLVHLDKVNSKIDIANSEIVISNQGQDLPASKVFAGISSFGFGGTNAHVVIESYGEKLDSNYEETEREDESSEQVAMLFTGQGSLFSGSIKGLYESNSVFRKSFDMYSANLAEMGVSVKEPLLEQSEQNNQRLKPTNVQQPALVAIQLAQLDMWKSRGVIPKSVLGHSVGELAAAVASGVMEAEDALALSIKRSSMMFNCDTGSMAAIMLPASQLQMLPKDIVVAAENGPSLTVIAGPTDILEATLEKQFPNMHVKLPVSHAFHSPLMADAASKFSLEVSNYKLRKPKKQVKLYSTLTGREASADLSRPEYWGEQILNPVKFVQAVNSMFSDSQRIGKVIELGGGNTLIGMAKRILPELQTEWIESVEA